jgi:hypothetical protein
MNSQPQQEPAMTLVNHRRIIALCLGVGLAISSSLQTHAQDVRIVILNGKVLNLVELAILDTLNCGYTVPNGAYWINEGNRTWGAVGSQGMSLPNCSAIHAAAQAPAPAQQAAPARSSDWGSSPSSGRIASAMNHVSSTWGTSYVDPVR